MLHTLPLAYLFMPQVASDKACHMHRVSEISCRDLHHVGNDTRVALWKVSG